MRLVLPAEHLTLQFPVSKTPERNTKLVTLLPSVFPAHQPQPELPRAVPHRRALEMRKSFSSLYHQI